jgi:hypothetical protein
MLVSNAHECVYSAELTIRVFVGEHLLESAIAQIGPVVEAVDDQCQLPDWVSGR